MLAASLAESAGYRLVKSVYFRKRKQIKTKQKPVPCKFLQEEVSCIDWFYVNLTGWFIRKGGASTEKMPLLVLVVGKTVGCFLN